VTQLFWVCVGSAVGGGGRYLLVNAVQAALGPSFPYGTLTVNVSGSFLLSVVAYAGLDAQVLPPLWRLGLASGVLGGFTTYSAFSYETFQLLRAGSVGAAVANVGVSVFGCLAASAAGWVFARWLLGPGPQV
jgi:fluoride exporter